MSSKIEDYAMIGDCHSAALVSRDGSIDWLCLPHFSAPACFAALVGTNENGRFKITPTGKFKSSRRYVDDSLVLENTFVTRSGKCRLTDAMIMNTEQPELVRIVEGVEGTVELEMELIIRYDYGSIVPWLHRTERKRRSHRFEAIAGPDAMQFISPVEFSNHGLKTTAKFRVSAGEKLSFCLVWYPSSRPFDQHRRKPEAMMKATLKWWHQWASRCTLKGKHREQALRSLITLKALTYRPTGGIVAAPTTSLPEEIGGERNWDYRLCWIRDATFTLYSLLSAGFREEAENWWNWLIRAVAGTPSQINIMYGLNGERRLPEFELEWLRGYEKSKPVRQGNAAAQQLQLDIFGELMDTSLLAFKSGLSFGDQAWSIQVEMLDHLSTIWKEKDDGIWEVRGPRQHFTHSKVMAWVAFDRGIKIAEKLGEQHWVRKWTPIRDEIHAQVCRKGFNRDLNSFVQSYGSKEVDASLLLIPLVGFLPPNHPQVVGTVAEIERKLVKNGWVSRYRNTHVNDGLSGTEGHFLACSFWLVDVYLLMGRQEEGRKLMNHLFSLQNDVGLLSEEYDSRRKRLVGNFPQAFSHVAMANSLSNFYLSNSPMKDRGQS